MPCYNEQEVLPLFYEETGKVLQKLSAGFQTELVFVNDGSADNTLNVLKQFAEKDPSVKYISFSRNFGKESAMLAGMEYAVHADYVGIIDADLQHSPDLITEMLYYVDQEGYDVAAAKREDRAGEAKLKSALSEGFYKVINRVSDTKISDSAQDFRIMKRKVVEAVLAMPERIRFSKGIFSWVGFNVKWIAHENRERAAGETKWSIRKLFRYAFDGILSFTDSPLRLSFLFSAIGAFLTLFCLVYALVRTIIGEYNALIPVILAAVFGVGAVILFVLGVFGEYLARIYTEAKGRPQYVVSETNTRS